MKSTLAVLIAASLFTAAVPAMAMTHSDGNHDDGCVKNCDTLAKNSRGVDTIQQKIQKMESAIKNNAAKYTPEQLATLKANLDDAQQMLANLEKG